MKNKIFFFLTFYRIILTFLVTIKAEFRVTNYTSSKVIIIDHGNAKIQDGTFNLVHIINIHQYEDFLNNIQTHINKYLPHKSVFFPLLQHEISQSLSILESIKPSFHKKSKRAINMIGTAWKYLAGSPDHDDLELINKNLDEITMNNNKQVKINQLFNERLSNLTKISNSIINTIKIDSAFSNQLALSMQSRLRLVKEELINLKYAILWEKNKILNTMILNKNEIKIAIEKLEAENMPFLSIEDALEYAEISVMYNNTALLYVVKIPITTKEIYKRMYLSPVILSEKAIIVEHQNVIKHNNKIFGIKNKCKEYNSIVICKTNQLSDISNDNCLANLLNKEKPFCTFSNTHHIPQIELLQPGILLLNNFNGTVDIGIEKKQLLGTFIIKFFNETVKVNNETFQNQIMSFSEVIPKSAYENPEEKNKINLLSLEFLKELHFNNTNEIFKLRSNHSISQIASSIFFLSLGVLVFLSFYKKKKQIILQTSQQLTETSPVTPKVVEIPKNVSFRFNDIPYF